MSGEATTPMKKSSLLRAVARWIGLLLLAGFIVVIVIVIRLPTISRDRMRMKRAFAQNDLMTITSSLKFYIVEFGASPVGDQAQVMVALLGKNPRQIVFLEGDSKRFNPRGEFVDPWGHPYRFDASNMDFVWAYSFGENGIDEGGAEGSDDIASWR